MCKFRACPWPTKPGLSCLHHERLEAGAWPLERRELVYDFAEPETRGPAKAAIQGPGRAIAPRGETPLEAWARRLAARRAGK